MKKFEITKIPGNFPALRATLVAIEFDGGSFVLSLQDLRDAEPHPSAVPPTHFNSVEVGRFMISPTTLAWLERALANAKRAYETAMGHPLPDPHKVGDALNAAAAMDSLLRPPDDSGEKA